MDERERSSFVFHCEYRRYIRMLPVDEQICIYDFLTEYCQTSGTAQLPALSTAASIVLMQITERMTQEFQKYDEVRAERAKGGKKGGRPKKVKGDEENLMDSEKPYGLCENLKVSEKPEGFSENQKNPVSVFKSDSVSVSDSVCVGNESDTHPTAITLEDVRGCYEGICKELKVTPLPGEVERWFPKYANAFTNREVMRQKIEGWVNDDVKAGKYNRPQKTMKKPSFVNYEQSNTDWNANAELAMELQEKDWEGENNESNELNFVDE